MADQFNDFFHLRRLYFPSNLEKECLLSGNQHHYIRNVQRMSEGDKIRLFNEQNGEYLFEISKISKKEILAHPLKKIRDVKRSSNAITLFFTPLSKERQFWLIEKATELGVTDLKPIITQRSEIRKINLDKTKAHIIEATEQSERIIPPAIHEIELMQTAIAQEPFVMAAIERDGKAQKITELVTKNKKDIAVLIGPPGGFTDEEKEYLTKLDNVNAVTLGENILRSETACITSLAQIISSIN